MRFPLDLIVESGRCFEDSVPFEVFHKQQGLLLPNLQPIATNPSELSYKQCPRELYPVLTFWTH